MAKKIQNIVTVGGGTGSPTVNRALLLAGAKHINAIAAMYDNGGYTGHRRLLDATGQEVAYSDALRIMKSLIDPNQENDKRTEIISRWLTYKNGNGEVPGYGLAHNWFDAETAFEQLEKDIKDLGIKFMGRVLPSSTESAHIKFKTQKGGWHIGEHLLDKYAQEGSTNMIVDMVLDPAVSSYTPARKALQNASIIFLPCGSIHGSVLCNFLPEGMQAAIAKSKAKVYLITNLTSTSNENREFSLKDYINLVERYIGQNRVNGVIVPQLTRKKFESKYPDVKILYDKENSHFLGWEQDELDQIAKEGIQVIKHKATKVISVPEAGTKIVRHDPKKLAEALKHLINA